MNYLAHLYLARHSHEAMLGALLGDFVFGRAALDDYSPVQRREILLHRGIDRYTDAHPAVVAIRERFPDGLRRFAGIALDVYFDHLLARDWREHSALALDAFTQPFYRYLLAREARLPGRLRRIAPLMAQGDWLGSYRHRDTVDLAVTRIAGRLSRNGARLVDCLAVLRRHEIEAEAGFATFFPDLVAHVDEARASQPPGG